MRRLMVLASCSTFAFGLGAFAVSKVSLDDGMSCGTAARADLSLASRTDNMNAADVEFFADQPDRNPVATDLVSDCMGARRVRQAWSAPMAIAGALGVLSVQVAAPERSGRSLRHDE